MKWNVEELKLYNEWKKNGKKDITFDCENISQEEKIEFLDSIVDGKVSYTLNLIKQFNKDKKYLPKTQFGDVKINSLKAWLRRNDSREVFDEEYCCGKAWICGKRIYITHELCEDTTTVDEIFHAYLIERLNKEIQYFKKHDEYTVLTNELVDKQNRYGTAFGVYLCWGSRGVNVAKDNQSFNGRPITLAETKQLLACYDELDKKIEEISQTINIKY